MSTDNTRTWVERAAFWDYALPGEDVYSCEWFVEQDGSKHAYYLGQRATGDGVADTLAEAKDAVEKAWSAHLRATPAALAPCPVDKVPLFVRNDIIASLTEEELKAELERRKVEEREEALVTAVAAVVLYMGRGHSTAALFAALSESEHFFQPNHDQLESL